MIDDDHVRDPKRLRMIAGEGEDGTMMPGGDGKTRHCGEEEEPRNGNPCGNLDGNENEGVSEQYSGSDPGEQGGGDGGDSALACAAAAASGKADTPTDTGENYEGADASQQQPQQQQQQQQPRRCPVGPPKSLPELARYILSPSCQSIVLLTGAGISVSSGIMDYRSAGGFYDTIDPTAVTATEAQREVMSADPASALEKNMFLQNPFPLLELKREFILGTYERRWRATIAHRFQELLHAKTGKLTRIYTQNIDGLENQCTQLPPDKVLPVHGSMGRAGCAMCGSPADYDDFCQSVRKCIKDVTGRDRLAPPASTPIVCEVCGCAAVKPTVVLFHERLPKQFFEALPRDLPDVDLLIIMGTSLSVGPANSVAYRIPDDAPRVVINREPVGANVGIRYGDDDGEEPTSRDFFAQGTCDEVCLELIRLLGWMDDLKEVADDLPKSSAALLRDHLGHSTNTDAAAASASAGKD